jgi:chromosome segregation and condensation protein ScpB
VKKDPKKIIEAALFLSPRPLTYRELSERAGIPADQVDSILSELAEKYNSIDSALVIERFGNAARIYVSDEVFPFVRDLAAVPEFTKKELEIVAYIAMKGTVTRSELRNINTRADAAVDKLRSLGAVVVRKKGKTLEIKKTELFDRYFGTLR